jgi:hypothetical protein
MDMKKRALSLILALVLVCSILPITASAATYTDVEGTWAEDAIMRFSNYEILQGLSNGSFNPTGDLTRGQMAVIIARLLNLPEAEDAGFADVDPDAYYADAINRCAAAGIMLGSNGNAKPTSSISRQDTIVMLARALGITPSEDADLSNYSDADSVSDYAKGYVAAMNEAGIVKGTTTTTVGATNDIDRASFVTILDRAIEEIVSEPGTTYTAQGTGIVLVKADDATVTGTVQDVLVAQGTGTGSVTVKDAIVNGNVTVQSDATVTVTGKTEVKNVVVAEKAAAKVTVDTDVKADKVEVKGAKSDVTISGTTTDVTVANTATDATVTMKGATVSGTVAVNTDATVNVAGKTEVKNVDVAESAKAAVTVEKEAKVETVDVKGANTSVAVSGTVGTVTVSDKADNVEVSTTSTATITNVNVDADNTKVTGTGNVETVTVTESKQETAKVETPNTTVTVVEDKTISGNAGGNTGSTTTTTTTPSSPSSTTTDPIVTLVRSGVSDLNSITAFLEIATVSYDGNRTITVAIQDNTKTVGQVYSVIGQTLIDKLNATETRQNVTSIYMNYATSYGANGSIFLVNTDGEAQEVASGDLVSLVTGVFQGVALDTPISNVTGAYHVWVNTTDYKTYVFTLTIG